jgi:hypothetical protein
MPADHSNLGKPTPPPPAWATPTPAVQASPFARANPPKTKAHTSASKQNTNPPANNAPAISDGPQALEKMQENYMELGILGPLLVACVNEHDPTRRGYYAYAGNLPSVHQNDLLGQQFCGTYIRQLVALEVVERLKKANVSDSMIMQTLAIR